MRYAKMVAYGLCDACRFVASWGMLQFYSPAFWGKCDRCGKQGFLMAVHHTMLPDGFIPSEAPRALGGHEPSAERAQAEESREELAVEAETRDPEAETAQEQAALTDEKTRNTEA